MIVLKVTLVPVLVGLLGAFVGLLYKGIDRKLAARMQSRVGPPLRQPFIDIKKLLLKENIVPEHGIPWLFNGAPLAGLAAVVTVLLYLPIGDIAPVLSGYGDLILILYLFTLPALAMVIGGLSSGAPYSIVGAQREMVMMVSYELPLAVTIVTFAWKLNSAVEGVNAFSPQAIASNPLWSMVGPIGFVGALILLLVMVAVTPIELSKIPFDVAEAETEIAEGLLSEYSGRNLALFYITDAVKTVAMASLIVTLFFPYQIGGLLGLSGFVGSVVTVLFFLAKVFLVILAAVTIVRVAAARFKIDQVVYTFWIPLTLTSLSGLGLIVLDSIM